MSEFDKANFITDRAVQDDPYGYFDWVREQGPVWREPHFGMYMITGHPEAIHPRAPRARCQPRVTTRQRLQLGLLVRADHVVVRPEQLAVICP